MTDEVKDREVKVSNEGVVSEHTEFRDGRIQCVVKVPRLRVRRKLNGQNVEESWPRVGNIYVPIRRQTANG